MASPGGWRIIGRTPLELFRADRNPPALLDIGDRVRFVPLMIRVVAPGFLTTVQDLGRHGYGHLGVSASGAADAFALRAANLLVGNPEGAAALEMTLVGGTFVFERDPVAAGGLRFRRRYPLWEAVRDAGRCAAVRRAPERRALLPGGARRHRRRRSLWAAPPRI